MNRKELRELYQRRTNGAPGGGPDCLSEETFMRAGTGKLSAVEQQRVANHLRVCSDCAKDYLVARSLKDWAGQVASSSSLAAGQASEGLGTRRQTARPSKFAWDQIRVGPRRRFVAATAVVLVAAGLSILLWRTNQPLEETPQIERGGVSTSLTFEPPNRAILREPPTRLSWPEVESAEHYQVSLYDFESTLVWESAPFKGSSITIPDAIRQRLLAAKPYYWRVSVDTDTERRQMPLLQFVVSAEAQK